MAMAGTCRSSRAASHLPALDSVVADRPVILSSRDGHSAWVNTRAIELADLSADTPEPHDGVIIREPDGYPAGTLHEGPSTSSIASSRTTPTTSWRMGCASASATCTR